MDILNGTGDGHDIFVWFCGANSSLWQENEALQTVCLANAVNFILHASCFITTILLLLGCSFHQTSWDTRKLILRYPLHSAQWILMLVAFLLSLCSVVEGLLTDTTFRFDASDAIYYPTQPHLYSSSICGLVMTLTAMVYFHQMEVRQAPHMAWLLLTYWVLALLGETLQLLSLLGMDLGSLSILRFDLSVLSLVVYFGLLVLQVNNIRSKICCSKTTSQKSGDGSRPPNTMMFTREFSSFVSEVTFWWLNWVFLVGNKRPLEMEDLGRLPEDHTSSCIHANFKEAFLKEQERARIKCCKPSLWRVYWQVHGWKMIFALLLKISGDMCAFVGPLALNLIIIWVGRVRDESLQRTEEPHFITVTEFFQNGLVLVAVMFITAFVQTLLLQTFEYWCAIVGIHFRSAIQTMVFEKSLHLSTFVMSNGDMTTGQIANHMSTDAMNVFHMFRYICWMVSVPITIVLALALLILQMGYSAVLGMVVFILLTPIQGALGNYMAKQEEQTLSYADQRLKLSSEVLQGIKLLKMYGWEDLFREAIEKIRRLEIWTTGKMMVSYGILASLTQGAPLIVTLLSFGTYTVLTGEILTPEVAFSSLSIFMLLQDPLFVFPITFFITVNGAISTGRVAAFLGAPEVDMKTLDVIRVTLSEEEPETVQMDLIKDCDSMEDSTPLLAKSSSSGSFQSSIREKAVKSYVSQQITSLSPVLLAEVLPDHIAIKIEDGCFSWDPAAFQPTLPDVNVTIPSGKLTMVVGAVGSGKSSLLSAILEEMTVQQGCIYINGNRNSIAYAGQKAWLLNTSLKENILFGQPFSHKRYQRVISACALQADIDMLPAGDQTEIGEKGINLSGGQKQRISVARAMYSRRDIVLLDDPLSALDVHVGGHLFQEGIMGILLRKKKTVILVTHQLQYLAHADQILLMREGRIAQRGTLTDIAEAEPDLYSGYQKIVNRLTDIETEDESDTETRRLELMQTKRQISQQYRFMEEGEADEACDAKGRLIEEEEMERGSVSWNVYYYYAKAIKLPVALLILLVYPIQAGIIAGSNYWLSEWSEAGLQNGNATDTAYYVKVYAALTVFGVVNSFTTTMITVVGLLVAARYLFNLMLRNIIHMPMRFFDTTPIGRIINRFSSDTQIIDMKLTLSLDTLFFFVMNILAALVINTIISPIFLAIILPFLIFYYLVQKIFITTSRELQRLDSISKSPIFSYFSETLGGLSTIRAYRKHQAFFDTILERVSVNNTAFLYLQTSLRWLAVRLDLVGAFVVLIAGLTTVLGSIYGSVDSSLVGLGISYALLVSVYLQQLVRYMAETEMQMNAVERLKHYTTLPTESYEGIEPPSDWPSRGAISIDNISVRYAVELDPVLQDVSVEIQAGEKIGICGRTGSGKSSLTLALLRIVDTFKGRILIDDVDIATVPLTTLRRRLSIIPQDPVLFNGTIRMNLDPDCRRTERELWDALEIAQLKDLVMQMNAGLDSDVSEGGENFSIGQRQLFCLARAFLRNSNVLIMDEATASIDVETDRILQHVVATAFAGKTVLTIAHRVATILNSDAILTLSKGEVVEHDTPENLLANPDSVFASLVNSDK